MPSPETCPVCMKPVYRSNVKPRGLGYGGGFEWPDRTPGVYCDHRSEHSETVRRWRLEAYGRVYEMPAALMDRRPLRLRVP